MIQALALTKEFPGPRGSVLRAVDGVSFTCHPGRIYGLLGANGAGKTTTLRMLATLLKPTSGNALVGGHDVVAAPDAVRSKLGFMAATTALYGRLTARETIAYFARLHGMPEDLIPVRTEALSRELGLGDFLDRRVDKFSTGMKQRLSIARTVVHDPDILILDEPTLGLDVMTARNILRFVRDFRERGKTVIFSSHVMSEIQKLCDTVGIIHRGRLIAEGSFEALRAVHGGEDLEDVFVRIVGEGEEAA
jgi:sodium transport system ATP-binding protein